MLQAGSPTKASVWPASGAAVLADRQQVGQRLAGVELVGERVDDGYAGVGRPSPRAGTGRGCATRWPRPGVRARARCRRSTRGRRPGRATPSMIIGKPPSSAMPEAKDAWVRRVGLSKSTATVRGPASGRSSYGLAFELQRQLEHRGLLLRARGRRRAGGGGSWLLRAGAVAASRMSGQASRNESAWSAVRISGGASRTPLGRGVVDDEPRVEGGGERPRADDAARSGRARCSSPEPRTSVTAVVGARGRRAAAGRPR